MPTGGKIGKVSIMSKIVFEEVIQEAWVAATALGDWTSKCPELNQCAVTSMLVQDYFGGRLLRCECDDGVSHYWNLLPGEEQWDLTRGQFEYSGVTPLRDTMIIRSREYLDGNRKTVKRYKVLKKRFERILGERDDQ